MAWFNCCCPAGCPAICEDDFNRSDSTDINTGSSCGWTEINGDWEILSNQLRSNGTGIARCDSNNGTTASDNHFRLRVTVTGDTADDLIRIICNYEDTSNYDFAEIKLNATTGHVKIFERIAGSDTELNSMTLAIATSSTHHLELCADDGFLRIAIRTDSTGNWEGLTANVTAVNGVVALGTSGSGDIDFDGFQFYDHMEHNADCIACVFLECPSCNPNTAPEQWQVDLSAYLTPCTALNATWILDREVSNSSQCVWSVDTGVAPVANNVIVYVYTAPLVVNIGVSSDSSFNSISGWTLGTPGDCSSYSANDRGTSSQAGDCFNVGGAPKAVITSL